MSAKYDRTRQRHAKTDSACPCIVCAPFTKSTIAFDDFYARWKAGDHDAVEQVKAMKAAAEITAACMLPVTSDVPKRLLMTDGWVERDPDTANAYDVEVSEP